MAHQANIKIMKLTVGIITFHRANNYGAVLQCYALQEVLTSLGYDAVVIDYRQSYVELAYNPIRWDIIRQGLTRLRLMGGYLLKVFPERWDRAKKYNRFRTKFLKCTTKVKYTYEIPDNIDIYIIGSDQMWSLHCTNYKIDKLFFGVFPHSEKSKICGYAISSNLHSLHEIGDQTLSSYVKNFNALSFREEAVRNEVEKMTGVYGRVDIDPSLLLDTETWTKMADKPLLDKKYLLTYFLHDDTDNLHFKAQIEAYAHKKGCVAVDIFDIAVSPTEFLSAIKYATCIVTSSFHATAFSILFKKPFYSLRTDNGKDIRYISLLNALGIPERVVDIDTLNEQEDQEIDHITIQNKLNGLRSQSIAYLKEIGDI